MTSKWGSSAGPIQTKRVSKALSTLQRRANETVELHNMQHDGMVREYEMVVSRYGFASRGLVGEPTKAETDIAYIFEQLGERFAWTITRQNAADVLAAALEADSRAQALRPVVDMRKSAEEYAAQEIQYAENRAAAKVSEALHAERVSAFRARAPKGAHAAIVAEYSRDDSHSQSDYSNSHRLATFLIGWRFGPREDFKQLRTAAERFQNGVLPVVKCDGRCYGDSKCPHGFSEPHEIVPDFGEWTEHRDNYSMGHGNYLSDHGWAGSGTGWIVKSVDLSYANALPLDAPDYTNTAATETPAVIGETTDATITPSSTGKPGYVEVHFATKPDEGTRTELKRAGFRWALRSTCWYGPATSLPDRYRVTA